MKKSVFLLLVLAFCLAFSADIEKINIPVGSTYTVQTPFMLKDFRLLPTGTNKVRIEEMDSQLRVIASAIGDVTLIVNGITGEQRTYSISVKSNLSSILRKLRNDLDSVPELDISLNDDRIVIKGIITDPGHWMHLQRVLPLYSGQCVSFATFAPSAETVMDLRKRLVDAGFTFSDDNENKPGILTLKSSKDTIFISGSLYSQESIAKVNQIVDTAPIFSYGLVKKVVNLTLLPTILEVNIAFVSLADTDDFSRNGNLHPTLGVDASFLRRWLDGNDRSKTIGINAQMGGTLSMLQTNFIAKVMDQGIVTFANDSPEGGKYKFGGNIKIPVSGGDNGDLKDISYGYDVKVKGGLVSENQVRLDLDIRSQTVDTDTQGNYDQKENSATLTLPMNINDTYIVAHHKKATETSVQTGTPVLGRVPLLKYLFSSTATEKKVVNVLVLVSTTVQTLKGETIMPMETKKVIQDAKKDTGELLKESGANGYSKDFKNLSK